MFQNFAAVEPSYAFKNYAQILIEFKLPLTLNK
jgi:hypothetical protein